MQSAVFRPDSCRLSVYHQKYHPCSYQLDLTGPFRSIFLEMFRVELCHTLASHSNMKESVHSRLILMNAESFSFTVISSNESCFIFFFDQLFANVRIFW
jgi:hypothetical protein